MNYKKALGLGVLLWLVMFAVVSAVLSLYQHNLTKIIIILISGAISFLAVRYLKAKDIKEGAIYGLIFLLVGTALDFLVTKKFNPNIFGSLSLWSGYGLILIGATFQPLFKK
jgi:hypothetical protein